MCAKGSRSRHVSSPICVHAYAYVYVFACVYVCVCTRAERQGTRARDNGDNGDNSKATFWPEKAARTALGRSSVARRGGALERITRPRASGMPVTRLLGDVIKCFGPRICASAKQTSRSRGVRACVSSFRLLKVGWFGVFAMAQI